MLPLPTLNIFDKAYLQNTTSSKTRIPSLPSTESRTSQRLLSSFAANRRRYNLFCHNFAYNNNRRCNDLAFRHKKLLTYTL